MSLKVGDNKLLKNHDKIWEIIRGLLNTRFDSETVYGDNDKYIKTNRKLYEDKVNTNFQGKDVPKEDSSCKSLSLFVFESVIRASKKYYPQKFLGECNYAIRKKKWKTLLMII